MQIYIYIYISLYHYESEVDIIHNIVSISFHSTFPRVFPSAPGRGQELGSGRGPLRHRATDSRLVPQFVSEVGEQKSCNSMVYRRDISNVYIYIIESHNYNDAI